MATSTTVGIFPSDIVIRTTLIEALADLRRYPAELDAVFEALAADEVSRKAYGEAESEQAKAWFRRTEVPVRIVGDLEPPSTTSITILLADGHEDKNTLGDGHYAPTRPDALRWTALAGPLVPDGYEPSTGVITLPASVTLVVVPGMIVVDRAGRELVVQATPGTRTVRIAPGSVVDLNGMEIRGARPARAAALRSVVEAESYRVTCWTHGEPQFLSWLFAILKYSLYRSRVTLEDRGMMNVSYSFGGPALEPLDSPAENVGMRLATINSLVRQTWIESREERIASVDLTLSLAPVSGDDQAIVVMGP